MTNANAMLMQVARIQDRSLWLVGTNGEVRLTSVAWSDDLKVGDDVLVWDDRVERAPEFLRDTQTAVGVVRDMDPERSLLVSSKHGWVWVRSNGAPPHELGDEVEFRPGVGIRRVLEPITEKPRPSDRSLDEYLVQGDDMDEGWADIAGYEDHIGRVRTIIEALADSDAIVPARGVLLSGPPGTGKTMLARVMAKEAKVQEFFQLRGPEITSKWVNESEENLRRLFDRAESAASAIIFIDEIDSIAARRSSGHTEHSDRLMGQLLSLMSGFNNKGRLLVVGATNRPELLDPALLRQGRFDVHLELLPPTEDDRARILRSHAPADLKTSDLIEQLAASSAGWVGADLRGLWRQAELACTAEGRSVVRLDDVWVGHLRVQEARSLQSYSEAPE